MKILQADPGRSFKALEQDLDNASRRVLSSGWYILGKEVRAFEDAFAEYLSVKHVLGVANGTDALELILRGLEIGPGDHVATVANTAVATVSAIGRAGAEVRFADIDPGTLTISPESLEALLKADPAIRAVIAVHLFGNPCSLEKLLSLAEKHHVFLIEDCAQAHGAGIRNKKCGTFGIASGFSFYPTKNLGAFGDGGAVATDDDALFERMKKLRQYGWGTDRNSAFPGINSRLDELQAAFLSVKLRFLDAMNDRRRKIASLFRSGLSSCSSILLPAEQEGRKCVYHQFVIRVPENTRERLMHFLAGKGIGTAIHYPVPVHLQEAYKNIPLPVPLMHTEEENQKILSLPIYPELRDEEVLAITDAIGEFFR